MKKEFTYSNVYILKNIQITLVENIKVIMQPKLPIVYQVEELNCAILYGYMKDI